MSLITNSILSDGDHLVVWEISESLDDLREIFFNNEKHGQNWEIFRKIKLDKLKKQWLATRLALREITKNDPEIQYDEHGAPWIQIDGWEISISHSAQWVSILLSKSSIIGIDLQSFNSKINNIAAKFTHKEEFNSWKENNSEDYLHALWTVKESVYKAFKHSQAFKKIRVTNTWPFETSQLDCIVERENRTYSFKVNHMKMDGYYLSYVRL